MLDDLYSEIILEESKNPNNKVATVEQLQSDNIEKLTNLHPNCKVTHEVNPSCGDEIYLSVILDQHLDQEQHLEQASNQHLEQGLEQHLGQVVKDIKWVGSGCAISQSAMSIVSELVKGQSVADALKIVNDFIGYMNGSVEDIEQLVGDLVIFEGVKQFPMRIKCAILGAIGIRNYLN
jgi:nitrogen fixation NifU-like protein